jgi:sulfide dehydrogenase cytochrome subunit
MRVVLVALATLLLPGQSWSGAGQGTAEPPPEPQAEAALLAASCSGCHMQDETEGFPQIYGRPAAEIRKEMLAFRSGAREGTVMNRIAKGYSEKDIDALAHYLAAQGGAD